jgi:large subunit ribosomal protein L22
MQVKATARYVRVAPNKARQVIEHIRGLGVDEARRVLQFSPKGISEQILKTLNSAVANAEHNNDLDEDDLVVTTAFVDEGPIIKRFQPRAMGRAYRIRKRTSHITIAVGVRGSAAPGTPQEGARRRGLRRRPAESAAAPAATATKTTPDTEAEVDTPASDDAETSEQDKEQ